MAWITGTVSKEELEELVARGWEPEEAPPQMTEGAELEDGDKICMFYVDSDVFALMSGPDWDTSRKEEPYTGRMLGDLCVDRHKDRAPQEAVGVRPKRELIRPTGSS